MLLSQNVVVIDENTMHNYSDLLEYEYNLDELKTEINQFVNMQKDISKVIGNLKLYLQKFNDAEYE